VHVRTRAGDEIFEIDVDSKSTNFRTRLDGAPIMVQVDPRLHVLKTIDIDMPRGWWMTQATEGETIAARRDAIDALREYDAPATIDLLRSIAEDTEVWYTERESAIGAIASYGSDEAREALLEIYDAGIEDPRVRATAIAAFDNYDLDIVRDRLMAILDEDPGYDTRVSAIGVLAELEAEDAAERIASMAHVDSQHDQIRTAAIRALRELEDDRGRDIAMQYAKWGHHDRSRATVIGELGRMATDEDDEVIDFIIDLLDDPHTRPRRAAGEALVEIGSERGLDPLRAMARSHPDPAIQERAERWVAELEAKVTE